MFAEKIEFLENVPGWAWEVDLEAQWFETAYTVKKFVNSENKIPSSHSKIKQEKQLGKWVGH